MAFIFLGGPGLNERTVSPMEKNPASVSILLERLKKGDEQVGGQIWQRYMQDLIALSRRRLNRATNRKLSDEEDIAVCAFNAFLMGVRANRFQKLDNRDDLWQVLVMLADRNAIDQIRKLNSKKRGEGKVRGESVFVDQDPSNPSKSIGISALVDDQPTPEFAVQFGEEVRARLSKLNSEELNEIVMLRLEGYTNQEIADRFNLSLSTIERKLKLIRKIWTS